MPDRDRPPVVAVVGATATGKSALAVALAHALDGEVVNGDALQFYRGMDVGTAKVTAAEREGVPHHLLDVRRECFVAADRCAGRLGLRITRCLAARGLA